MLRHFAGLALPLILLLFPPKIAAQSQSTDPPTDAVREQLRTRIEAERRGLDALNARNEVVHASATVLQFYEERDFDPVWIGAKGPTSRVDSLVAALRRADREGLSPKDYHTQGISALLSRSREGDRSSADTGTLTDLELLCTDAFLLYASHLLSGHVSPVKIIPSWNVPHRRADLLQMLTEVAEGESITAAFASVRPSQPEYQALKKTLQRYRTIASEGGWPAVPDGPTLKPGMSGDRVGDLHRRLAVTEALPSPDSAATVFDATLKDAVVAFQERHGLEADGVVGPATRAALNVPAQERIQQLIVNLERWRWLPQTLGEKHIIVNIAASHLRFIENGTETLSMRVVTGRPYRQTPVFSDQISYLVFNPYWHVPHSIATQDKLPEMQKDPSGLTRQNIRVFRGWGADAQPIDPSSIDWSQLSRSSFPYRLRQDPGPFNALGRVKFMFPNPHNVYLHDTPTRGLFAKAERNFSSGCIRLERPIELAEHLLAGQSPWTADRIQSVLKNPSAEQSVTLRQRIPVHLQYWTAWTADDGAIQFRGDTYNRDAPVLKALNASPPTE